MNFCVEFRYTFDSLGRRYDVPMYIFKDPDNLIDDVEEDDSFNVTNLLEYSAKIFIHRNGFSLKYPTPFLLQRWLAPCF